jgi:uroporphyrinogen-III synthase
MYKYDIQNIYDGSEYFQSVLLKTFENNNIIVFLSRHAVKNLQSVAKGKKKRNLSFKCVT